MNWTRVFPVFSIAFSLIYVPAFIMNWPLFTYVPRTREFHWFLFQPATAVTPGMYYYGWLMTAALGAIVIALPALALPERLIRRMMPMVWIIPLALLIYVGYELRGYFFR